MMHIIKRSNQTLLLTFFSFNIFNLNMSKSILTIRNGSIKRGKKKIYGAGKDIFLSW